MADRPEPAVVAAFDLDGTLSRHDTLLPFLWRACGPVATARALAGEAFPMAVALSGRGSRDAAKEALLVRLLAGRRRRPLEILAEAYTDDVVSHRLRRWVVARLHAHRQVGHRVVIVSSSPELYVAPLGRRLGTDGVLGTVLEVDGDGRLTGRLAGPSCRGAQKVVRLEAWLAGEEVRLWAYGDSAGDDELLARADVAVRVGRRPSPASGCP